MAKKTSVDRDVADELEDTGIPRPDKNQDIPLTGDEAIFKHLVITPEHPIDYVKDDDGVIHAIPKLTRTMALGNLTPNQMSAMDDYFYIAETCRRLSEQCPSINYWGIVNRYYLKISQMCVTSQAEGGKLLTMAMTEQHHYGIHRTDTPQPDEEQNQNPLVAFHQRMVGAAQNAQKQNEAMKGYGR